MVEREKAPTAELVIGYVTAFLLFPIGLLIGIHVRARDTKNGIRLIAVSSAIGAASILFGVIGSGTALMLSAAVIAGALGISLLAEGRREGGGIGGIALIGAALVFALLVLFAGDGNQGGPSRDEQIAHAAQRNGEKMAQCVTSHPNRFKECERRIQLGKQLEPSEQTMSAENVEIVREHLDALNAFMRGKISSEAWLAFWEEEAEFYPLRAQLEGESYLSHDGLMRFVAELTEDFEEVRFEYGETRDAGEQVVGIGRFRARGRASGVDINVPIGAVQGVRRGKIVYTRFFSEPADALEAAGLRQQATAALDEKRRFGSSTRYWADDVGGEREARNEAVRRFFAAFEDEAPPPRAADPTPNNRRKQN